MFEVTLSGCWPNYAQKLIYEVTPFFAIFWMVYVLSVVFAIIRIITALFLRNTLKAASEDEDMMVLDRMKEKEKYAAKLTRFFKGMDKDGDGTLDRDEFDQMCENPQITSWLTVLGLEMYEVQGLFDLLDDGDGRVAYQEFVGGCLRLKGNARAIDSVLVMHGQTKILDHIESITETLSRMSRGAPGTPKLDEEKLTEKRSAAHSKMKSFVSGSSMR